MRRAAALIVIVIVMAACSSNELASQGDRSRAGKDKAAGNSAGKGKQGKGGGSRSGAKAKQKAEDIKNQAPGSGAKGSEEVGAPGDFGGADAPSSGIDPSLARASGGADDSPVDARTQGVTPRYSEATGARIQGLGKNVRFTIMMAAPLPDRVEKNQYMVMAFGVTGQKEGQGYAVGAIGNDKGWDPYAGSKGDNDKFPGRFEISGNEVIFEIPWSYVKGPRAFEWYVSSGWYGKVANQTHWSFDSVPNERAGEFPG